MRFSKLVVFVCAGLLAGACDLRKSSPTSPSGGGPGDPTQPQPITPCSVNKVTLMNAPPVDSTLAAGANLRIQVSAETPDPSLFVGIAFQRRSDGKSILSDLTGISSCPRPYFVDNTFVPINGLYNFGRGDTIDALVVYSTTGLSGTLAPLAPGQIYREILWEKIVYQRLITLNDRIE